MKVKPGCLCMCFLFVIGCTPTPDANEIRQMEAKSLFSDCRTADLVLAAEAGDIDKINHLVNSGTDVNSKGRFGVTPLLRVAQKKNKEGYAALLALGADPNILDQNGFAAMNIAAEDEDSFWLREALAHGGKPNLENVGNRHFPGQTPLFFAIWKSRDENASLLINAGADVNHESEKSGRPVDLAMGQSYRIVFLLLDAGAEYRYQKFDLVEMMNLRIRNGSIGTNVEKQKWFNKTMELLEKKGVKFDRLQK